MVQLPIRIHQALESPFSRFAHAGTVDDSGERIAKEGDVPSRLFLHHQFAATQESLKWLDKDASSKWVRSKAGSWKEKLATCGSVPRYVFLGDLLQNAVGLQRCQLDICPYCMDAKRRRHRRRFQHIIKQAFKSGLDVLHVTPEIEPRFHVDLADAYELNRLAWSFFSDSKGFWKSATRDWIRGRHFEQELERGRFRWNVHDHLVLVLKGNRSKAMSSPDRLEQRIALKWKNAVDKAAHELGLGPARGTANSTQVIDEAHGTSLARYLTRAPLQRAVRKRQTDLVAMLAGKERPRSFSALDLPQAEEFILATRNHRYFFLSKAARKRTEHFSSKEFVPKRKLRTKGKAMKWHEFREAARKCVTGDSKQLTTDHALLALPHVVATLLVFGLDPLALDLIDDWLLILDRVGR